jgi:PAS domain S-box-containing protein
MSKDKFKDLRRRAEEQLAARESQIETLEQPDLKKLVHELAVHQVELEIQNEELRQSRTQAEEVRDRYVDLYDFAPVGYFTIDEHSRVVEANLTGCQLLKIDRSNLLKKSFTNFIHPGESKKFYLQRRRVLESGTRQTGELQMQTAQGTAFYAQIESLKAGEERLRLVVMDITERKKAEETLAQQKIELEASNKELEAFSYAVSHDLRAPLRSMAGFSTALLEDYSEKLDGEGKQFLKHIQDSSELMALLIDDLLKLSQVIRTNINYDKVNVSDVAQEVVNELAKTEATRNVKVIIAPDIIAYGDRNLLRLVLGNLIGNAWKFSSKIAEPRIEIGNIEHNDKQTYFVRDNGVGFDMTYAGKLFKPFQRLHQASEFPGTGIGLATVQPIIHRHGGEVWVESKVGEGATFFFTVG